MAGAKTEALEPQPSPSTVEWKRLKKVENAHSDPIDALMELIGLEDVKSQVLSIRASLEAAKRQDIDIIRERYHVSFLGNPGTG